MLLTFFSFRQFFPFFLVAKKEGNFAKNAAKKKKVKDIFDYDPESGKANPQGGKQVASVVTIMFAAHYNF